MSPGSPPAMQVCAMRASVRDGPVPVKPAGARAGGHQPQEPGSPLKGPTTPAVIHPP